MDIIYNKISRPINRKRTVCLPSCYFGFSDVNFVSKVCKSKRSLTPAMVPVSSDATKIQRVTKSRKCCKIETESDHVSLSDTSKPKKISHIYMMEQKIKWKQKQRSDHDLKKQTIEKKKESLKQLQETSKLLLKRNLRKKALQNKKKGWSSQSPSAKQNASSINSNSIIEQKKVFCSSKLKSMKNDCSIINQFKSKSVTDKAPLNVKKVPSEYSSQLVLYKKSNDISNIVINNNESKHHDIAAVKIQRAFRDYQSRKRKKIFNKDNPHEEEIKYLIENQTKSICIKSDQQKEEVYVPKFPNQTSIDYPYNFITAVKKKLSKALNSPLKRKDDKLSSRIFKTTKQTKEKFKENYQDSKPSFINLYNVTPIYPFFDSVYSKPRSHFSETSLIKYLDSSNTSCEVSLYKKSSNTTSLSEYPSESKIKAQSAVRTSTIISELKSSLEEIQNLTVSITFNGLRDNQSISTNMISDSVDKHIIEEHKMDTCIESNLQNDIQDNLHTIQLQSKDESVPVNVLNPPDINLIWSRNHSSRKDEYKIKNAPDPKKEKAKKYIIPDLLHKSFENELNLLESFNKSLQQVQVVEKSITSIRDEKSSDTNMTRFEDHSENYHIKHNFTTSPLEKLNTEVFKQNECLVAAHQIHNLSSSNEMCSNQTISNSNILKPFTIKSNEISSEMLSQIFGNKNDNINIKEAEPNSRNKNVVYSQKEYNHKISVKHSLSCEDESSIVSFNETSTTGVDPDKSLSHYSDNFNLFGQLNRFCVCLVNQYIEDEKVRSEYVNTLLKAREKSLLDATRNELLCLEFQKKQNLDQIPLLKKKQRGLVLKHQQERNEIKHMKKFQQEQSQERKMALRRQLKYLKRMFAYEESLLDIKKKTPKFKNSSFILQSNRSSQSSPLKGINLSLNSSTNTMNSSFSKLKESLQKKRLDLLEQKKKMHELLQMHYNLRLDTAEIKAMESKLKKSCLDNFDESKNSLMDVFNDYINGCTKTNSTNSNSDLVGKALHNQKSSSTEYENNIFFNNYIPQEHSLNECVLSGSTLNKLWEKITGKNCEAYENLQNYVMSKKSLDEFFAEAKKIAIQDLLKSLEYDTKKNDNACMETDVKNELVKKNLKSQDMFQENKQSCLSLCSETIKSSSNLFQTNEEYSVKSDIPITDNTANYLNSTKILNNLLQSESYDLEELRIHKDLCNNIKLEDENLQISQINREAPDISTLHKNVLSETFTVSKNLSDSCDQSDTSESTAHSLVEELTKTDITKLNECCENVNVNLVQVVPLLSVSNKNLKYSVDTKTDNMSPVTSNIRVSEVLTVPVEVMNISTDQIKQVTPDTTVLNILESASVILYNSPTNEKSIVKNHGDMKTSTDTDTITKIESDSNIISPTLKDKTNKSLKKFQVSFKSDCLFDRSDKNKTLNVLCVKMSAENKSANVSCDHVNLKPANDALCTLSLEICSKDKSFKPLFADDKAELHHKITNFVEGKSPNYSNLLMGSWEATSPSPEPSPRDSPTGEYSPASAVIQPICQVDEAEELRKKQLAIELEIKALEQQSQLPYCLVREIPDKPPPPYTPPSEETKLTISISPRNLLLKPFSKVFNLIESCSSWLWLKYSSDASELITYHDFCKYDDSSVDLNNGYFLFEICREIFEEEFSDQKLKTNHIWEYKQIPKIRSMRKVDVCLRVQDKVKKELGLEFWPTKDNHIIPRPHKRQDYISELLTKELYQEESSWSNIEKYENQVKNELTATILNSLIIEACQEYRSLFLLN